MEDPAIYEVDLDRIIPEAIDGNPQALDLLMRCLWMLQLLNQIADWAWRRKKIDVDIHGVDIQDIVAERIRQKIHTVKNPSHRPWCKSFKSWCYRVAARCCENVRKTKQRAEQKYQDEVIHDSTVRIEGGMRIIEPCSTMMSQQEEIEQKEQTPLRGSLKSKIRQTVRRVFNSFTPEDAKILTLWGAGKTLKQISVLTNTPLPTVQRKLKKLQKTIKSEITKVIDEEVGEGKTEELRVVQALDELLMGRHGLQKLLANSL
jgi:RNA polymerase sigma factor (sigma-70 family)